MFFWSWWGIIAIALVLVVIGKLLHGWYKK